MRKLTTEELQREWHELAAGGIYLEPPEFRVGIPFRDQTSGLVIRQERDLGSQVIFELPGDRTGYILKAFIQAPPGKTRITNYWLELPWPDAIVQWLPDPAEAGSEGMPYTFTKCGWPYPRKDVLNHRMKEVLTRYDIREGLLLGEGLTRPPKEHLHGTTVHAILHICNQRNEIVSTHFELYLDRRPQFENPGRKTSTRGTLFSKRDRIYPTGESS
jgi:hypothetical protein